MSNSYLDATLFCIPILDLYLLAILNSSLIEAYYKSISSTIRGDFLRFKKIYLFRLPIMNLSNEKRKPFIKTVETIFIHTKDPDYPHNPDKQAKVSDLERQIDKMVYELYELTPEEIDIVEGRK
jgi:hypothetical protein